MVSQKGTKIEVTAAASRMVFRLRGLYSPYMLGLLCDGIQTWASPCILVALGDHVSAVVE
jgi:hypothetical protein